MGVWSRVAVPGQLGHYRVFEDDVERGDIVLEHSLATTLSAKMVAALNPPVPADHFVAQGWSSAVEYHEWRDLLRMFIEDQPLHIHAELAEARDRQPWHGANRVASRAEMESWRATVDAIIAAHATEAA